MSTSKILQYLESGNSSATSHRAEFETFIASGAIALGAWVSFDTSKSVAGDKTLYVVEADANATDTRACFGVAAEAAAAAGDKVKIQIAGLVSAKVDGTSPVIAAGDALFLSDTAGVAIAKTDATGANVRPQIGTAIGTANNAASIICLIHKKF